MKLKIFQADAFTDQLFSGNPAAVCPLEKWLPDSMMQTIAAENNLAETAFYIPKENDFHLRWFTPAIEVDLCGHATLATAHVMWNHLGYSKPQINFHSKSGMLSVRKNGAMLTLNFPTDEMNKTAIPKEIKLAINSEPVECYQGKNILMVVLKDQKDIEALNPDITLETLIPDFKGEKENIQRIIDAAPEVVSHNIETVERLTRQVRIQAKYHRSMDVIKTLKAGGMRTKSGIMLGLGEAKEEVIQTITDLRDNGCDVITIGQYLQPTKKHLAVHRFVHPDEFAEYREIGYQLGLDYIESGPLVRSSYHSERHVFAGLGKKEWSERTSLKEIGKEIKTCSVSS